MLVKTIRFKDVWAGDVVARKDGERLQVLEVDKVFGSGVPDHLESINLLIKGNPDYLVSGPADGFIGLVHRRVQRPENYLLDLVAGHAYSVYMGNRRGDDQPRTIELLLKAIEDYELSKPKW